MRVRLKGIASATYKRADGTKARYWYAWRGGPKLPGEPGTPEFMEAYHRAIAERPNTKAKAESVATLIVEYKASHKFTKLGDRTKIDYLKQIKRIEAKFATMSILALEAKGVRRVFEAWREEIAVSSPRGADYAWMMLKRIFSVAKERGRIKTNPCEGGGLLYKAQRQDAIWTSEDEALFLRSARPRVALAFALALWTGQRQGDLLRLRWDQVGDTHIRLQQSKRGKRVVIPIGTPLRRALAAAPRTAATVLATKDGTPWTSNGFQTAWRDARIKAGLRAGLTFHDLRGSAVTRLARAGCTVPEIATFTGHSLADVHSILDAHYLSRDVTLADAAMRKLEASLRVGADDEEAAKGIAKDRPEGA